MAIVPEVPEKLRNGRLLNGSLRFQWVRERRVRGDRLPMLEWIRKRRLIPLVTAFPVVWAVVCVGSLAAADTENPNILFIQSDDHGWADVGFRGSIIDTPNIDSLAAAGVILDRYHTYPTCGPTRIGLMTGRNPITVGITGNINEGEDGVPLDEHMLPETFSAAGYQTWMMGKWHLGGSTGPEYLPQNRGFDHFYGFLGGSINETTHVTTSTGILDWQRNGVDVPEDAGQYATDLMATEAISLIKARDPTRPFLIYLSFHALHTPYDAPQPLKNKYALLGLTGSELEYAAMAENMDINIGRVLDTLEDEGIDQNTIVVFVSDNGAQLDKGGSNLPLRGHKNTVFEGGHRVPAVISWPAQLPTGVTSDQFVSHIDWLPTLAVAAGIETKNIKPLDGKDRWSAFQSGASGRPTGHVIDQGSGDLVLDSDWKLSREAQSDPFMLFDVYADPSETTDVAAQNPDVVAALTPYLDPCPDAGAKEYGTGCAGTGGLVPALSFEGCPMSNETVSLALADGRASSLSLLLLGLKKGNEPLAGSCLLNVKQILPGAFFLPLDASGAFSLSVQLPPSVPSTILTLQAFVADDFNLWGYSNSNGIKVAFQP